VQLGSEGTGMSDMPFDVSVGWCNCARASVDATFKHHFMADFSKSRNNFGTDREFRFFNSQQMRCQIGTSPKNPA
jgi:hypothetical protein